MTKNETFRLAAALMLTLGLALGCSAGDNAKAASAPDAASEIVAKIGDEVITRTEVEEQIVGELNKLDQDRYNLIKGALDNMIDTRLAKAEAAKKGITIEELIKTEVGSRVEAPTDEEIEMFYNQRKAQMQGRTLEQMKDDIANFIRSQRGQTLQLEYLANLRAVSKAKILLDVPRIEIEIPDVAMSKGGDKNAPVTIVEFADFECGYCRQAHPSVARVLAEYGDAVRYTFVDYPLEFHKRAIPASVAARCADDQGKFWEYHENLMVLRGDLGDADLKKRAADMGLDMEQFDTCYADASRASVIETLIESGKNLGVTGTPTFYINGRMMVGAKTYDDIKAVVDEEIARAAANG